MPVSRLLLAVILAGLLAAPAAAGIFADPPSERGSCLTKAEQRALVLTRRAVPLGRTIKILYARGLRAEVVRASLCRRGDGLVYVLTLLARNGKVTRATVDAANGELITGH
jgi:hypothetical protein